MKIILFILVSISYCYPQTEWKLFNINNSPLISNKVYDSIEDEEGSYYITTDQSFFKFITPDNWVRQDSAGSVFTYPPFRLHKDKFNRVWAFGNDLYFLQNGSWNSIELNLPLNDGVSAIAIEDTDLIWIGTYLSGFYKYDFNQLTKIEDNLFNYEINQIIIDTNNKKWVAMDDGGGLVKYNDQTAERIYHQDFISPVGDIMAVEGILINSQNQDELFITAVYLTTVQNGTIFFARYDMNNETWIFYDSSDVDKKISPSKRALSSDDNNNIWIGTNNSGILTFKDDNFNFITVDNSSLPENNVWNLFIDSHNNKWICGSPVYGIAVYNEEGISGITSVDSENDQITDFQLYQNYPNPFNPVTTIKYTIPSVTLSEVEGALITLKVYDVLGKEIATLVNEEKPAGAYKVEFGASNLSSGIYFYQIKSGSFIQTRKMMLIK